MTVEEIQEYQRAGTDWARSPLDKFYGVGAGILSTLVFSRRGRTGFPPPAFAAERAGGRPRSSAARHGISGGLRPSFNVIHPKIESTDSRDCSPRKYAGRFTDAPIFAAGHSGATL